MVTTDTGAKKISNNENWRNIFDAHNDSVDAYDDHIAKLDSGLAYVAVKSGNDWMLPSGKNASSGDYVIVNKVFGHATATLTGGSTAIVENTNWVAESAGALNSLNNNLTNLDTDCKSIPEVSATKASGISTMSGLIKRNAFIVNGTLGIDIPSDKLTANSELAVLDMTVRTSLDVRIVAQNINTRSVGSFRIYANNGIPTLTVDNNIALPDAGYYFIQFTFLYY